MSRRPGPPHQVNSFHLSRRNDEARNPSPINLIMIPDYIEGMTPCNYGAGRLQLKTGHCRKRPLNKFKEGEITPIKIPHDINPVQGFGIIHMSPLTDGVMCLEFLKQLTGEVGISCEEGDFHL
ncbi:hypothetical protein KKH23_08930 [Patescibacteria group bacterium]|nr:hypothetical protein [Patescibacteria group bacterium]